MSISSSFSEEFDTFSYCFLALWVFLNRSVETERLLALLFLS